MRHEVDLRKRDSDVIFNDTMEYRYWLRRRFNAIDVGNEAISRALVCLIIMLNPSKADAYRNDNTVSRCIKFAQLWRFYQLWVCNIFAYRSTYPVDLYTADDPIGKENDHYIGIAVRQADLVVVAYGNHGEYMYRGDRVIEIIRSEGKEPYAFGLTNQLEPIHPLARGKMWIPYDRELKKYEDLLIA